MPYIIAGLVIVIALGVEFIVSLISCFVMILASLVPIALISGIVGGAVGGTIEHKLNQKNSQKLQPYQDTTLLDEDIIDTNYIENDFYHNQQNKMLEKNYKYRKNNRRYRQ